MEQDGYRITREKVCQKPAGDSRRLTKKMYDNRSITDRYGLIISIFHFLLNNYSMPTFLGWHNNNLDFVC